MEADYLTGYFFDFQMFVRFERHLLLEIGHLSAWKRGWRVRKYRRDGGVEAEIFGLMEINAYICSPFWELNSPNRT